MMRKNGVLGLIFNSRIEIIQSGWFIYSLNRIMNCTGHKISNNP